MVLCSRMTFCLENSKCHKQISLQTKRQLLMSVRHFVLNLYYQLDLSAVLGDTHEAAERDNIKID